jgi:hypothetical protein
MFLLPERSVELSRHGVAGKIVQYCCSSIIEAAAGAMAHAERHRKKPA